ncbi:DUF4132 domain-containing protein [Actinomadura darangshiensis]|uniref:DUF4132 domain-containing protein n=1 Tax=Actinomadura darangshiensis TaxID=705336 RepID=A0A4R5BFT3_9ACTN|nr:DUF4132 domain-containing protein [Actinomadura darangshiensis]TDD84279.1 DUF4132 domain-containing protein [Actinomadura darangshiensis]
MSDDLRAHLDALNAPRPTRTWRRRTLELLDDPVARGEVLDRVRWYATKDARLAAGRPFSDPSLRDEPGARGRVWAAALVGDPGVIPLLDVIARRAAGVTREFAPAVKLAGGAVNALGEFADPRALDVLRGLSRDVRDPVLGRQIRTAIEAAAGRRGITPAQLVERGVPAHGLGRDGSLARDIGGYQAVLAVTDPLTVRLTFIGADGRPLPTVPGALRGPFAAPVKELKTLVKRVRATLAAERTRVEALMAVERTWPFGEWCHHYRDHPVTGMVARGLIWEFETPDGRWHGATPGEGVLVTVDGRALPVPSAGARVRLWHPARALPGAVRAWRGFVTGNRMTQSFKQAFRETFRLGPPEAGPELRCGCFDGEVRRVFAEGAWRVSCHHGPELVRFERRIAGRWRETPPADVPPLVFSEGTREVALFVRVTSIAAQEPFGELSATAGIRGDTLRRILPGTRIADRFSVDGRFLVVRGGLRTYKIHLDSGGVLMEPGDDRLHVEPSRRLGRKGLFLPFEDERLTQILGTAFLLAADHKITDEAVLGQITRGA